MQYRTPGNKRHVRKRHSRKRRGEKEEVCKRWRAFLRQTGARRQKGGQRGVGMGSVVQTLGAISSSLTSANSAHPTANGGGVERSLSRQPVKMGCCTTTRRESMSVAFCWSSSPVPAFPCCRPHTEGPSEEMRGGTDGVRGLEKPSPRTSPSSSSFCEHPICAISSTHAFTPRQATPGA